MRILLVDDEPSVRELALRVLAREGHEVVVASSGSEAVSLFAAAKPEVLFVDKNLPDGSGLELSRAMREADPELGVVLITGAPERMAHDAVRPDVYLGKPFKTLGALQEAALQAVEQRRIARVRREAQQQLEALTRQLRGSTA